MIFLLIPPLKYAHTWRGKEGKTIKINSVGRKGKHKYDFCGHSRRLQLIFNAHPKEFFGVKLQ